MGACRYCGQPAGFFRGRHAECETLHDDTKRRLYTLLLDAMCKGAAPGLPAEIRSAGAQGLISEAEQRGIVIDAWAGAVGQAFEDGLLSEEEESRLASTQGLFNLTQEDLDSSGAFTKLAKGAVLRELMQGNVPRKFRFDGPLPFNLQKGEELVWAFARTEFLEDRNRREYVGRSSGVSVRIMKGVYYRTGTFRGHPVDRTERVHVDTGLAAVTTKHIYFAGPAKSFRVPFSKVVSFQPFEDGIGLTRDAQSAKPQIFVTGDGWFTYNLVTNLAQL